MIASDALHVALLERFSVRFPSSVGRAIILIIILASFHVQSFGILLAPDFRCTFV